MKLKELIRKLQKLEKSNPGSGVGFQIAMRTGLGFRPDAVHLLHIGPDGDGRCSITLGEHQEDAADYQAFLDWMKEEDRKFGR